MKDHLLLRIVSSISIPFIFLFGLYVLFHGKISPGGGFQGGTIWATGLVLHSLVFGAHETKKIISVKLLQYIGCIGVLLYSGCGLLMVLLGGRYLQYNAILSSTHQSQFIGIMTVEVGIHLAVFAILSLIYWRLVRE
jgi:multicomponent Na+:H+ antiporter subunit B